MLTCFQKCSLEHSCDSCHIKVTIAFSWRSVKATSYSFLFLQAKICIRIGTSGIYKTQEKISVFKVLNRGDEYSFFCSFVNILISNVPTVAFLSHQLTLNQYSELLEMIIEKKVALHVDTRMLECNVNINIHTKALKVFVLEKQECYIERLLTATKPNAPLLLNLVFEIRNHKEKLSIRNNNKNSNLVFRNTDSVFANIIPNFLLRKGAGRRKSVK